MIKYQCWVRYGQLCLAVMGWMVCLAGESARSQSVSPIQPLIYNTPDWEKPGAPGRRDDGGKRGDQADANSLCQRETEDSALTAVAPENAQGLTTQADPTFHFYSPYQPDPALRARFELFELKENNQKGNRLPVMSLSLAEGPGIIRIPLPLERVSLASETDYSWRLTIICNPSDRAEDVYVEGVVRRVSLEPSLREQLETANSEQQAILYARNGIWYDAVSTLLEREFRRTHPQTATTFLTSLFESEWVKLDELLGQPIVECCTPVIEQ